MPPVHVAHDLRLQLVARPGSMAALLGAFDAHGIAVRGIVALGEGDLDEDHFLVEDADAAVVAADTVGATEIRRRAVLVVELSRVDASAAAVLRTISSIGAGIDLLYLASNAALVIGIYGDDLEPVQAALTERTAGD